MTRSFLKAAILLAFASAASTAAHAHANLDHATPAVGSTVGSSPSQVVLYFTEKIEAKFSGAEIRSTGGTRVDNGNTGSGNSLRISVGRLAPGTYTVKWHVLSVDTHKTQGSFSFSVSK